MSNDDDGEPKDGKPDDILEDAKEIFELSAEREEDNRREALDDLRFARLAEQWPDYERLKRQREFRPCLTINKLPAILKQVTNDARQNKPSIKVHPADSEADPHTAEVYNGLIRNIEASSRAGMIYDTALDFAVTMGFGYFRVNTEYACDDTFDLDLVLKRIANPFSVYGDPYSTESDSSDWNDAFVTELIPKDLFSRKYKGAAKVDWTSNGFQSLKAPWRDDDRILVAEYFQREAAEKTIVLLSDGSVADEEIYKKNRGDYEQAQITVISERAAKGYKVTQRIMTGMEVLETKKWAGKFIPIIPVYGEEINVEGKRSFRGLVRDAKDPQRMHNYWRTASTELVALAPKAPWIGKKGAFKSDAAKWATANTSSHQYMEFDGDLPPQRQPFAGVPAGALQEAINAADDIKAVTGIFDASLGAPSNETSGRAILARQREGDVSTFNFVDNLARAIEHGGRILLDLIPAVYNGQRIVRVLGLQSGDVGTVQLNTPTQIPGQNGEMLSHVYDLSRGKYDLTVETGPSFTTRREEAANQMTELMRAFPPAASVLGDLLAKNLDWPDADLIAKRLQALLPPQLQGGQQDQSGQAAGQAQAMQQQSQALMQQVQTLSQQLQALQADKQLETAKVKIDAFKAETERLRAHGDIAAKNRQIFTEAMMGDAMPSGQQN